MPNTVTANMMCDTHRRLCPDCSAQSPDDFICERCEVRFVAIMDICVTCSGLLQRSQSAQSTASASSDTILVPTAGSRKKPFDPPTDKDGNTSSEEDNVGSSCSYKEIK